MYRDVHNKTSFTLLGLPSRAIASKSSDHALVRSSMPSPGQQVKDEQHNDTANDHHEDLPLLRLLHNLLKPADGALQAQPRAAHVLRLRTSSRTNLASMLDNEHIR